MSNVNTGRSASKFEPSEDGTCAPVEGSSAVGIWPVVPPATVAVAEYPLAIVEDAG